MTRRCRPGGNASTFPRSLYGTTTTRASSPGDVHRRLHTHLKHHPGKHPRVPLASGGALTLAGATCSYRVQRVGSPERPADSCADACLNSFTQFELRWRAHTCRHLPHGVKFLTVTSAPERRYSAPIRNRGANIWVQPTAMSQLDSRREVAIYLLLACTTTTNWCRITHLPATPTARPATFAAWLLVYIIEPQTLRSHP